MATKENTSGETDGTLAGACELGFLEETWEHFFARAAYKYLFVIDAPAISSVHAIPPHNVPHFGLSSFLPSPDAPTNVTSLSLDERQRHFNSEALRFPLTLAITELLARYIFTTRWSGGEPKLISHHQLGSLAKILDAVESHSMQEISQATRSAGSAGSLQEIRDILVGVTSAESLIEEVSQHLQRLLPGVYGAYTTTRQLFRYLEVLPFGPTTDGPSVFLDSYSDIRRILEGTNEPSDPSLSMESLYRKWAEGIPPSASNFAFAHRFPNSRHTPDSARSHAEHARTLAEIEYINRAFEREGSPYRLVFVTPTGRLFRAAQKRFGIGRPFGGRNVRFGSADSFDKIVYHATLLSDTGSELSIAPLLDPRVLMTSPDFVAYASRADDERAEFSSRSISSWIPILLSPMRRSDGTLNATHLLQLYDSLQIRGRRTAADGAYQGSFVFRRIDAEAVRSAWDSYIRTIAAAESSERIIQREAFAELRTAVLSSESADGPLKEVVSRKLDSTMSQWLSYVGGRAIGELIRRYEENPSQAVPVGFVATPPVIVPALSEEGLSVEELASDIDRVKASDPAMGWLTQSGYVHPSLGSEDQQRHLKTRYLQILGQSRLFASIGDWESANTLADQAFSLANNILSKQEDRRSRTYISGREAAFYASFTLRRFPSSLTSIDQHVSDGQQWVQRYAAAVESEDELRSGPPVRLSVHRAREHFEELAWTLLRWFYHVRESESARSQIGSGLLQFEYSRLAARYDSLCSELQAEVSPQLMTENFESDRAFEAYREAAAYLVREAFLHRIELEVVNLHLRGSSRDRLWQLLKEYRAMDAEPLLANSRRGIPSVREHAILALGDAPSTPSPPPPKPGLYESPPFNDMDQWRLGVIRGLAQ